MNERIARELLTVARELTASGVNVYDVMEESSLRMLKNAVYGMRFRMGNSSRSGAGFILPFRRPPFDGQFHVSFGKVKYKEFKNGTFTLGGKLVVTMELDGKRLMVAAPKISSVRGKDEDKYEVVSSVISNAWREIAYRIKNVSLPASEKVLKTKADNILSEFADAVADPNSSQYWWIAEGRVMSLDERGYPAEVKIVSINGDIDGDDYSLYLKDARGISKYLKGKSFKVKVTVGFIGPRDVQETVVGEQLEGYPAYQSGSVYEVLVPHQVKVKIRGASYRGSDLVLVAEIT